ncbi:MAG: thioredoxin domain-containing protein [Candidatus Dormibacteria bacterium]
MNRLASSTSPYLRQHADNPVDWYPWGEEALERSRREQLPILLSVGYSACHWCHVMERESFTDPAVATLMNRDFVCVKVDREERPDLDALYMEAVQAMTGHGGWPMTVFLTPLQQPFFAGTYFPPADRHGLPGFPRVLESIALAWRERRDEVEQQGLTLKRALEAASQRALSREPLTESLMRRALETLTRRYDPANGGFGGAPKFPSPMTLEFLVRCHLRGHPGALDMLLHTLERMDRGGIHDQLGGGFHRYATDVQWLVPHFEKMLYDNAQLARVYLQAWQLTGDPQLLSVVRTTLDYLLREMAHPAGGFYSAQDADSEGEEGRFFTWSHDDFLAASGQHGPEAARYFGLEPDGNWDGTNILHRLASPSRAPASPEVETARERLLAVRRTRVAPATDDKVLTAWNALAIRALAEAGAVLEEPRYLAAASGCAAFIDTDLRLPGGRLARSWREGVTGGPGFLEDHAGLCLALLSLHAATGEQAHLERAIDLAADTMRLFRDPGSGGFMHTGLDQEALLVRRPDLHDNAEPSGNSLAADALKRVAHITGDSELAAAAVSALRVVADLLERAPEGFGQALCALDLHLGPITELAIVGSPSDPRRDELAAVARGHLLPRLVIAFGAGDGDSDLELLRGRATLSGGPAAYVCHDFVCAAPVTEPAQLRVALGLPAAVTA